ncbi:MAG: hypothetical protein ACREFB_07310 [Stellaceae bacterium]
MRLKDFIQDTLYEIALGVQLAQAHSKDLVAIAPSMIDGQSVAERTYVDFDVAVVVGANEKTSKGGKVKAGAEIEVASIIKARIGGGGEATKNSQTSTERTHRVAFKVPVYMTAHFRDNAATAAHAKNLLETYGTK